MSTATFDSFSASSWSLDSSSSPSDSSMTDLLTSPYPSSISMRHFEKVATFMRQRRAHLSTEDWKFALGSMKQEMYNSTGVDLPSPIPFLIRDLNNQEYEKVYLDISNGGDISAYRQVRSERVVSCMFAFMDVNVDISAIINLGKSVYIHNITQAPEEFNDPFDHLLNQIMETTFVPYSYSFGARYTDVFGNTSDIVIRGNMPTWVQSLFLAECFKQETPIRAGDSRTGLFVFAPVVTVQFESLHCHPQQYIINPELTLLYEKRALDFTDPDAMFSEGGSQRSSILKRILVCDVPDQLAHVITQQAIAWASSQGFML